MENAVHKIHAKVSSSQPPALYVLFFVELWERFSYYGIRVLLILYMTSELKFSDCFSYGVYGMYFALVSASTVLGGYLADHYLGNRKAIYLGTIIIIAGHICLFFFAKEFFYLGLGFIVTGTGFFKPNITSLLGQYYHPHDPRRDSGFTIFYMGINLGSFLAPFICGYIGRKYGWHYGFGTAGLGMLIGLFIFYHSSKILGNAGHSPNNDKLHQPIFWRFTPYKGIIIGAIFSILIFSWCIQCHEIMGDFLQVSGIIMLLALIGIALKCKGEEKKSMLTLIMMLPFFVAFWTSFEQAGASINLFIDRHVNRVFMGYEIETTWFLSLNPFLIIVLAPVFSTLWIQLGKRNLEPITPTKFSLALFQVSLSFWFLKLGVQEGSDNGMTSMGWIILSYFFRTTGELCLAPVALSMFTKLAPSRLTSFMIGNFFLSIAFAQFFAQQIPKYFTTAHEIKAVAHVYDKTSSFLIFGQIFEFLIYLPLIAGIIMFFVSLYLKSIFKQYS